MELELVRAQQLSQQYLHLQIGKATPEAHAGSVTVWQRRERVQIVTGSALAGLEPTFRFEALGVGYVLLHRAGHQVREDALDLWGGG